MKSSAANLEFSSDSNKNSELMIILFAIWSIREKFASSHAVNSAKPLHRYHRGLQFLVILSGLEIISKEKSQRIKALQRLPTACPKESGFGFPFLRCPNAMHLGDRNNPVATSLPSAGSPILLTATTVIKKA